MTRHGKLAAFFSFEGRTRRRDWWLIGIALTVLSIMMLFALRQMIFGSWTLSDSGISQGEAALGLVLSLAFLWPITALSVRRAHDRDKSGWLALLAAAFTVVDGISMLVAPEFMTQPFAPPFSVWDVARHVSTAVSLIVALWLFVTLGFLDGTPGPNRYGPSPKGIGQKD